MGHSGRGKDSESMNMQDMSMAKPKRSDSFEFTFQGIRHFLAQYLRESGILTALIILIVVGVISSPHFRKPENIINISRQIGINGILGIGMTFVILTAGI